MKRFTETLRMDEDWYCNLPLEMRAAFELLWAKADPAGVWPVNHRLAEFHIGKKVNWPDFNAKCGGRVIALDEARYMMRDLVSVNCGKLSRECKAHNHVFAALQKHGIALDESNNPMVSGSYPVATKVAQVQEDEKEENKNKTRAGEKAKPSSESEVVEFCTSQRIPETDGRAVWEKWQGNGFTNGGNKMKDWQATIRSWNIAGYLPSQKKRRSSRACIVHPKTRTRHDHLEPIH